MLLYRSAITCADWQEHHNGTDTGDDERREADTLDGQGSQQANEQASKQCKIHMAYTWL